jgi:hypothetical protein
MGQHEGLEYCKVDLVASKGVVFCKFNRASAALRALERVTATSTVRARAATPTSARHSTCPLLCW